MSDNISNFYWYINAKGSIEKKFWEGTKQDWTRYNINNYAEHYEEIRELWDKRNNVDLAIKLCQKT